MLRNERALRVLVGTAAVAWMLGVIAAVWFLGGPFRDLATLIGTAFFIWWGGVLLARIHLCPGCKERIITRTLCLKCQATTQPPFSPTSDPWDDAKRIM